MTSNIQISGKANDGTIFVVGGENFDDFYANLLATLGGDATAASQVVADAARIITPVSAGAPPAQPDPYAQAQANVQAAFPQAQPVQQPPAQQYQYQGYDQRPPAGPPPGQTSPLCPNHQQPAKWVPPGVSRTTQKPYSGFFACSQNDRNCRIPR